MRKVKKAKWLSVMMVVAMLLALAPAAVAGLSGTTGTDKYMSDVETMVVAGNVDGAIYPYPAVPANAGPYYGVDTWINQTGSNAWDPVPTWIWEAMPVENPIDGDIVWFERSFEVVGIPTAGSLKIACDNGYAVWLNGKFVGKSATLPQFVGADDDYDVTMLGDLKQAYVHTSGWQAVGTYDLAPYLLEGDNVLRIMGVNEYMNTDDASDPLGTTLLNPGGLAFSFTVDWERPETYDFCGYKYLGYTEEGLEGWTIELYQDGEKIGETITDASGKYCFTDLPAGTYVVKEVLKPGWTQIYPVPNEHTVVLPLAGPIMAPYGGSRVIDSKQGLRYDYTAVRAARSNPDAALTFTTGQNEANFYSLGFRDDIEPIESDGWIIIEFDHPIMNGPGNDLRVIEDTWGLPYPKESAEVWVGQDGIGWTYLGLAENQTPYMNIHTITDFDLEILGLESVRFVKVQDVSNRSDFAALAASQGATLDGFDLNAVVSLQDYEEKFDFRNERECLWKEETAWAAGPRYVSRGNWATYTPYQSNEPVMLYAGQHMEAGTVAFSGVEDGYVTITISLNEGWRFAPVPENVKIQGYASAPSKTPSPGGFAWKSTESGDYAEIVVPASNFYGVHVDVEWADCQ